MTASAFSERLEEVPLALPQMCSALHLLAPGHPRQVGGSREGREGRGGKGGGKEARWAGLLSAARRRRGRKWAGQACRSS